MQQLEDLGVHLAARRDFLLNAWRDAADGDPVQTTVRSLTRAQFNDHIPQVLDSYEEKLRARPGGTRARAADEETKGEEIKHGLQRWQQGYQLQELMHEWGHLQLCIFEEIEAFAASHPETDRETVVVANRELIRLVSEGVSESAAQYARLEQAEAAGHVRDLQRTLSQMSQIEQRRAALIHQAVHDLRGNVQTVSTAADALQMTQIAEADRVEFAGLLHQGVEAVRAMLNDLMELARLEAGQETREIGAFDAARLIIDFCEVSQPVAADRELFLRADGPIPLAVEGDPAKVRRVVQNLVLNALTYTKQGGVVVSWGVEGENWWLRVKDTGPGLRVGPGAPILTGLKEATIAARETEEKNARKEGDRSSGSDATAMGPEIAPGNGRQQAGEGIGLSIVKRLCELLDASVEMTSSAESGTTFRVVLPRNYQSLGPGN